jgi:hypothetical protein
MREPSVSEMKGDMMDGHAARKNWKSVYVGRSFRREQVTWEI